MAARGRYPVKEIVYTMRKRATGVREYRGVPLSTVDDQESQEYLEYGNFSFVPKILQKMKIKKVKVSKSCIFSFIWVFWHRIRVRDIKKIVHAIFELWSASFHRVEIENGEIFRFSHSF